MPIFALKILPIFAANTILNIVELKKTPCIEKEKLQLCPNIMNAYIRQFLCLSACYFSSGLLMAAAPASAPRPAESRKLDLTIIMPGNSTPMATSAFGGGNSAVFMSAEQRAEAHQMKLSSAGMQPSYGVEESEVPIVSNNPRSGVCYDRHSPGTIGGGLRWSARRGLGFYWEGNSMRHVEHLLANKDLGICPEGDTSALCRALPTQNCD